MFEFLRTERFSMIFSFILGVGCMALLKPVCTTNECRVQKAPPYDEVTKSTYQLGSDCYKFDSKAIQCPENGVIESFEMREGQ